MRILIIDPSGTDNYCNGLAGGINKIESVDVVVRDNYIPLCGDSYPIYYYFRLSSKYAKNKITKGLNYVKGYLKTLKLVKNRQYNVINIQWLLMYDIDIIFLKILKKYTSKLVYTAHNILPHVQGEKQIKKMRKIYEMADVIIVHGRASQEELLDRFPNINKSKVYIQPHGISAPCKIEDGTESPSIRECICNTKGRVFLYLGVIFDAKGVDRLFNFWTENYSDYKNDLLVVAGKITEESVRYTEALNHVKGVKNFLYLPHVISQEDHDYLYKNANIIILPYRKASMSGVIFDAARFSKALVTTNVGCIPEYLENGVDSYIVSNDDEMFCIQLKEVLNKSIIEMDSVGKKLNENINSKYNWNIISRKLIDFLIG